MGDPEGTARIIAESGVWVPIHLAIVVGLILMLGGLLAIYDSIPEGVARAVAGVGLVAAVVGTAVGLVLVTLDGFAAKRLAELWAATSPASNRSPLGSSRHRRRRTSPSSACFNLTYAGVTVGSFEAAAVLSGIYPRWPGWVVVVAAIGGALSGVL